MEDILDLYHLPYNPTQPIICMDEQPVQLLKETRIPVPAAPGRPAREDYEYERNGTASIFLFTEALDGWRHVTARERRTRLDWAYEIEEILEGRYAAYKKVILVMDNLNTHTISSLYEAFEPIKARRLAQKLEIHYTPKHGSWLNIAECELSALTRQCLCKRIPDLKTLQEKVHAWANERNQVQKGVNWQFSTEDARIKLKNLYPQIQC